MIGPSCRACTIWFLHGCHRKSCVGCWPTRFVTKLWFQPICSGSEEWLEPHFGLGWGWTSLRTSRGLMGWARWILGDWQASVWRDEKQHWQAFFSQHLSAMAIPCPQQMQNTASNGLVWLRQASVTGSCFFRVGRSRTSGRQRKLHEICKKKIYVSQQVIDQQAIRRKNLLSVSNCTGVAWRCCSIWTCSKLFLIPSSQQGKAQQTISTCTQESTYFACVLEEHTCYCWQVLDQRAS